MTRAVWLALLALIGLAGCRASDDDSTREATPAPSTTATTAPTTTTLPLPTYEGKVGATITTPYNNRVTLHAFENPAQRMYEPDAGYFYVAAEMESCISESFSGGDPAAFVHYFVVQTDMNARITGSPGRRPAIDAHTPPRRVRPRVGDVRDP